MGSGRTVSGGRHISQGRSVEKLGEKKEMVFTRGFIWGQIGAEAYKQRVRGEGEKFWERKRTRVSCSECGVSVEA